MAAVPNHFPTTKVCNAPYVSDFGGIDRSLNVIIMAGRMYSGAACLVDRIER